MIKFRHIDSASTFNTTKFSARSSNDAYFTGNDKSRIIDGSPTVVYDELVFCKELKLIYTHGELYNAAEADLSGYYTIIDANQTFATKTELSTKQNNITGSNGEVVYHNGTNVFTQTILNEGYVVNTQEDLNRCKNNSPSFEDVLNTWQKFSILNGVSNARPAEMNSWRFNNNTIIQPTDTESYVGFLSPNSYSSYDVTVRCYSTGADDDTIGLVAAYAKDSGGKEHTLSFLRTPGGTSNNGKPRWCAVLDYNGNIDATSYNQAVIVDNSSSTTYPASTTNWGTSSIARGTVINIVRNGNLFTARCSQFGSSEIDDTTLITLNLDTFASQYPLLNLFRGSSKWGYSTFSQPNTQYENIAIADPSNFIIDVLNKKVYQYNSSTKTWDVIQGEDPINSIGVGRFSYNSITNKLFYNNGTSVIEISASSSSSSGQKIHVIDASTLTNYTLDSVPGSYINDLVVITNITSGTHYSFVNGRGTTRHFRGDNEHDLIFRCCGNNRYQPIMFPILTD